jgi:prepilin-type N-terminal cleavage/methylation domain-containing protein
MVLGLAGMRVTKMMRANQSKFSADERMRGFTLMEIMVVASLILIISAFSIPKLIQFWQDWQLRSAAAEVAALTQQTRISAARANATYPMRFRMVGSLQQVYIDLNNNSALDTNEPYIDLPQSVTGASGAPSGGAGQPSAYTLVGDTSSGTPFDNSNVIAYSPRGLPCNYSSSVCATPAASYFVFYFQDSRTNDWAAVLVTKSGRSKVLQWNGGAWK